MTLHGHTRIELTDVHTGAVEVVESDNLITNAVSDIFNGYGGSLNKAMLLWRGDQGYTNAPKDLVTMFYGGLLLYDTPLGSDPATVFAPAGAGVVGTAGLTWPGWTTRRSECPTIKASASRAA